MEDITRALADFVRDHQAWAPPIVLLLAFGESLAFISLLVPAWGALVAIGALIGVSGISFWPVWFAGGIGAALGDWVSYWFGFKYKEHVAQMWPLSRFPKILPRGEAFVKSWGVPSIFIGRFFGPLAGLGAACGRNIRDAVLAFSDRQFRIGIGLVGGAAVVRRRACQDRGMALARCLKRPLLATAVLTPTGLGPICRGHDQRRDHRRYCSPPPRLCGTGGHLRLRYRLCRRIRSAASLFQSSAI